MFPWWLNSVDSQNSSLGWRPHHEEGFQPPKRRVFTRFPTEPTNTSTFIHNSPSFLGTCFPSSRQDQSSSVTSAEESRLCDSPTVQTGEGRDEGCWGKGVRKEACTVRKGVYQRQSLPTSKFSLELVMPQIRMFSKCSLWTYRGTQELLRPNVKIIFMITLWWYLLFHWLCKVMMSNAACTLTWP